MIRQQIKSVVISAHDIPSRTNTGSDVNDLIDILASGILAQKIDEISESAAFSISIDESADISNKEQLTVNIIYVKNGEKCSTFLGLLQIANKTSKHIFNTLIKFLEACGLDMSMWVAFGSDGANNMRGAHNGVAKLIENFLRQKHKVKHFIALHCVSHITALSAKVAAESSNLAKMVSFLIRSIAADFSRSTKKNNDFAKIQKIFAQPSFDADKKFVPLRIIPFHAIRWLSRYDSVKRLLKLMEPLLSFYENEHVTNGNLRYEQIRNYSLLKFLYVISDILKPLARITTDSQSEKLNISEMMASLTEQMQILESLKTNVGTNERKFNDLVTKTRRLSHRRRLRSEREENVIAEFFGHDLEYNENMDRLVENAKVKYIETALEDLKERFEGLNEETEKLNVIYDILSAEYDALGNPIEVLSNLYGSEADYIAFYEEVRNIRTKVSVSGLQLNTFEKLSKWILLNTDRTKFKYTHFFLSVILVLPFSTSQCERSFSAMNIIKSKSRNRLKEILNSLMLLYTCSDVEKAKLDFDKMAKNVVSQVWKYNKKTTWASADYMRSIV